MGIPSQMMDIASTVGDLAAHHCGICSGRGTTLDVVMTSGEGGIGRPAMNFPTSAKFMRG